MAISGSVKDHNHDIKDLQLTSSITPTGYIYLPGNLLLQWGQFIADANKHRSVTFPKSFKQLFSVNITKNNDVSALWAPSNGHALYAVTNTGFQVGNIEKGGMWMAIGRG